MDRRNETGPSMPSLRLVTSAPVILGAADRPTAGSCSDTGEAPALTETVFGVLRNIAVCANGNHCAGCGRIAGFVTTNSGTGGDSFDRIGGGVAGATGTTRSGTASGGSGGGGGGEMGGIGGGGGDGGGEGGMGGIGGGGGCVGVWMGCEAGDSTDAPDDFFATLVSARTVESSRSTMRSDRSAEGGVAARERAHPTPSAMTNAR